MSLWEGLKSQEIAGNQLSQVVVFFSILLLAMILGRVGKYLLTRSATRLEESGRGFIAIALSSVSRSMAFIAFALGFDLAITVLKFSPKVQGIIDPVTASLVTISFAYALYSLVDVVNYWLEKLAERTQSRLDDMLIPLVRKSLRITIIILSLLQVATILSDKPLTSVLAGLGVGGLAVALAAQETIKNFFGSIVIFSDKPFELGDRVVVDGSDGIVEEVGFRSTRIRTLNGHLVTVPNGELANKTIENIGKRPNIKQVIDLGVTYDTPPDKVKLAVEILKELLNNHEGMNSELPPRVVFHEFGDFSLNIRAIYWYHPPDYWNFMAFHENLCHQILERFNNEGIEFAFPTQTLFLASDPARPLQAKG